MTDKNEDIIAGYDQSISDHLNTHGEEIREAADMIDDEDGDRSETLDDIISEAKGEIGAKAANTVGDDEAENAIETAERWITNNVSNSTTDRRVAAAYALLGREAARDRLGLDTKTWRLTIDEVQHHRRIYTVSAATKEEAIKLAERGETVSEEDDRFVGVVSRDNAEVIED